ncbi:CotS family spore coat protein [Desulfitobacterium sp.]|uniref:CotS family spore coat protein n=1 Tax=Desulfitobacterium sp. TaxID=49981 RepID=UPI002B20CCA3|nr:CotS family spore coat protein [Desulfitobacterium sp.]MEA4903132.1 CotS family spore coat protein [Desulfitobacterium sp.]
MGEYIIQPWDCDNCPTLVKSDIYVPPEIDDLAQQVMRNYDMVVFSKEVITTKSDKGGAIWKIKTDKGPRSLKLLHRKPIRSLFSIGAQDYLVKQGARVPELKTTKEGTLYINKGGKLWIVTDWIEPLTPASKDIEGACALCYGLGEFHKYSRGYTPPMGSQKASRLYRWSAYYNKIIQKFDWFRHIARVYTEIESSQFLLEAIERFEHQAINSLTYLEQQSSYAQMISKGETYWGLVHQDYGWSNGQLGPGGLWVIDLDGVAYDLPIRDLRKLISGTMDDMGRWDVQWIQAMIDSYHQANPMDRETYDVLINDLAFPNEFYKQINELFYDPVSYLSHDFEGIYQHLLLLEETKETALGELRSSNVNYTLGSYESNLEIAPETLELMQLDDSIGIESSLNESDQVINRPLLMLNKKLNVLMICTEKLPVPPVRGGAIQTYIEGISGMLGTHHHLTILGTSDPSLPPEEDRNNIHYVRINGERVFEIYAKQVIGFLKDRNYDLIHVFNRPRLIPLIRKIAPYSHLILSMHNDMFSPNKIKKQDAQIAIQEVDRIITISDYIGKTICALYPEAVSKVHTIYSGVNLDKLIPWKQSQFSTFIRQKIRHEHELVTKTVILFVGRLTPKKGIDLLLHALNNLHQSNPNIALVIVGGTWYSENTLTDYVAYVRTLAERAPFPVITTGYVPAEEIHQWFWAADIFVCPSQWQEPLARVHYEAMSAGLPFVTTARGGNPEVIMEKNGLVVKHPEDAVEFAETLRILFEDVKLQEKMGQTGRRLAEERFSWHRVADEVLGIWKEVIEMGREEKVKRPPGELSKAVKNNIAKDSNELKKSKWKVLNEAETDHFLETNNRVARNLSPTFKGSSVVRITKDMIRIPDEGFAIRFRY